MNRRHPFLSLDRGELDEMLRSVFPGRDLELFEPVSGGRCNSNYRIVLRGERRPYFLRVYSRGREVALKEIALYSLLKDKVAVPTVVGASVPESGLSWAIFNWLPLPTLEEALPTLNPVDAASLGESCGETLAAIAKNRFDAPGNLGPGLVVEPWPAGDEGAFLRFVRDCLDSAPAKARLGDALSDRVWQLASTEAHRLDDRAGECCLVHSDFNPTNLLVRTDDGPPRIGAVVDWEFAHSGTPLVDFGNLMREHRNLPTAFLDAFASGFQASWGRLPDDWLARARLIDLTAHLEFLRLPEDRGEIHALALRTIERTLSHWDTYFPL